MRCNNVIVFLYVLLQLKQSAKYAKIQARVSLPRFFLARTGLR